MSYTNSPHFSLSALSKLSYPTPYFLFDDNLIIDSIAKYVAAFPVNTEICYAMKANSEECVLRLLDEKGASFEVSSTYELELLRKININPAKILFGTAVKSGSSIADFFNYGVDRYAFDSEAELLKIVHQAPGSKVYVRVLVDDHADSVFTMSEKFGTNLSTAASLLVLAKKHGLIPYGISFNVGSQARNVEAWKNGLKDVKRVLEQLLQHDIRVAIIDLGGGFPFRYQNDEIPSISKIGHSLKRTVKSLPYDVNFLVEPGRGLVANAFVLVVGIFAKNSRPVGDWLYVDAGAYNALLESMAYQGSIRYRVELLRDSNAPLLPYVLTGPTGDSLDVIGTDIMLPSDVSVGDKLVVRDVGAYSFVLATHFNGFPTPKLYRA